MDTSYFFDAIFSVAKKDGILILDESGLVMRVNAAFKSAFGYADEDVAGKHFEMFYTPADRQLARPRTELETARQEGAAADDVYLLHQDGTSQWVTGELYYIRHDSNPHYFIKLIHNIHAMKLLEKFVLEGSKFINSAFQSVKDVAMVVIDTRLNVLKSNDGFHQLFGLPPAAGEPGRLSQLDHPLWKNGVIRQRMRELIVLDKPFAGEAFGVTDPDGKEQTLSIRSKAMDGEGGESKCFLLVIREVAASREKGLATV